MELFKETINSWKDWCRVFQSLPLFTPIVEYILKKHALPYIQPQNLTPGTNAVFKSGDYVIKIFAPKESGLNTESDFTVERTVHSYVSTLGINCPEYICDGFVDDKYRFYYIVTQYVKGTEFAEISGGFSAAQKSRYARDIKNTLKLINEPTSIIPQTDYKKQFYENKRTGRLNLSLQKNMETRVNSFPNYNPVLTHSDITGENVIADDEHKLILIDFADAHIGPAILEIPPIVIGLFQCDKEYITPFRGIQTLESFTEDLINALAIHDFGSDLILTFCENQKINPNSLTSLEEFASVFMETQL